jgi:hypothetical protein
MPRTGPGTGSFARALVSAASWVVSRAIRHGTLSR